MADDIRQWLEELELGKYGNVFVENGIDVDVVPDLDKDDLQQLGVNLGDSKRLLRAIVRLRSEEVAPASIEVAENPDQRSTAAERRQLTVMFCDLVGSTALSRQLDPEDLRDVMRRYQDAVADAVTRYGGHIAKYLGDGVLAYFGWPKAYEDQAERAARAGLDAVEIVNDVQVGHGRSLEARVGIATGQVVVGDLVGEGGRDTEAVTGETPNLAARLQGIAEPGQVVVGEVTHRMIEQTFALEDLGAHELKGFDVATKAWRVGPETVAESRFEASHAGDLNRLVGREQEFDLLLERLQRARDGMGQVVLLSGEAGIGKSRLLQALRDQLDGIPHYRLRYQCSPLHSNSAFHPIIQRLQRASGFAADDDTETRLDKLEALLELSANNIADDPTLFAALLSLAYGERYGELNLSPQQQRDRTIDAMVRQVVGLSERRPILFLLEDAHWLDRSTEALVGEIMTRIAEVPVLMVITYRPEYQPPWPAMANGLSIALNRLSGSQGLEIVRATGGADFSDEVKEQIIERSGGIPLYVEELTKSMLESSEGKGNIPASLQASLMARLDLLGEAKELAQIGAVIGREFSFKMITAFAGGTGVAVPRMLERLVRSELVFEHGSGRERIYEFKHALIQDAAYQSLLRSVRQAHHGQVAKTLEAHFPETVEVEPELLAQHYAEAGAAEPAIKYWQRAGQRASEHSAGSEAVAHLTKGLELLHGLPETAERDRLEIDLQVTLGPPLITMKGWGAAEVEQAYLRTRELCLKLEETAHLLTATWGLWYYYQHSGSLKTAKGLADEVVALAERQLDKGQLLQAHHAAWTTDLTLPELISCREHAEQGIYLYNLDEHRSHAFNYGGHDPGVCCRGNGALALWLLGYADQAIAMAQDAVRLAEELAHPYSLVQALSYSAYVNQLRHDTDRVQECAKATITLCTEQAIAPHYLAGATILRGWAMVAESRDDEGIAQIRQGIDVLQFKGAGLRQSYYMSLLIDAYGLADEADQGLQVVADALDLVGTVGERTWEAELYRLQGTLLLSQPVGKSSDAECSFNQAIELARAQDARSWELRAAIGLARLWRDLDKIKEARDLLAPILGWFSEGFDTPDLKDAKSLLDGLS